MRPMLDDIELPQVQEITSKERRALAEHKPPGMEGSLLQNMGRRPTRINLGGVKTGPDSLEFLETLDSKFKQGAPLPFIADIIADAAIEEMIIDDLKWQELAGKPERYAYVIVLREYIEPTEPEDALFINTEILDGAQEIMNTVITGFELVDQLSAFLGRLTDLSQTINRRN